MKPSILERDDCTERSFVIDDSIAIIDGQYGQLKESKTKESKTKERIFVPYGSAVYLERIYICLETLERIFLLSFSDAQNHKVTFWISRKDMIETEMRKFLEKGCQVNKKTIQAFITSIMNQEPEAPYEMIHRRLGFETYNGKKVFLGSVGIGVKSRYDGELKIEPAGEYSVWRDMVESEVIGSIPLEFILAVACTAPLVDYFREELHIENILVSLVSESSSGKTTAGCLAVSVGAKASFEGDSTITTFADTHNSLMHSIPSSYPTLIDEGSLIRGNVTSLLYSLAQGKEKGRMTKELKKADALTFASTIFMTSEKSILQLCDANNGLQVRCIEIINVTWSKSAESADRIKQICEMHYGHVVPRIAEYLLNEDKETLISRYKMIGKELIEWAKAEKMYNSLTERFSKSVALILLGAEIASDILDLQFNIEEICNFIKKNASVYNNEELDEGKRAMIFTCQYISKNYRLFIKGSKNGNYESEVPFDCKGYFFETKPVLLKNGKHASKEVRMSEIAFREMLLEGGFQDVKIILSKWKSEGVLHAPDDRFLTNVCIGKSGTVKGYRFYISPDYMELINKKVEEKSLE